MYRYVFKRVRDTIGLGINVRKSFACQQSVKQQNDKPEIRSSLVKSQEIQFFPSQKYQRYDEFKSKYSCKHPNTCNNLLQAITWVRVTFLMLSSDPSLLLKFLVYGANSWILCFAVDLFVQKKSPVRSKKVLL